MRWPNVARNLTIVRLEDRTAPAVFTVTTLADSGAGSLRQAVLDANAAGGADEVQFAGDPIDRAMLALWRSVDPPAPGTA